MMLSPLAPKAFPALAPLAGVKLAVTNSGIRYKDRPDLLFVALPETTTVAGVLTRSLISAAPVDWCRAVLKQGKARGLVVNAGNANAFTGKAGEASVRRTAEAAAHAIGCTSEEIFIASTGVIGVPLADEKITGKLPALHASATENGWNGAAEAILTTDTFKKLAHRTARIGGTEVTIQGFAKGSGMIAPDMATMLAFIFTDAAIPSPVLQSLLSAANNRTFNAITVDSDTSTSDTALLFATGTAKHPAITSATDTALASFTENLEAVMRELAQLIVKDGEGATKFVSITVTGAEHDKAARTIGLAVGNSPLVKTALAAGDANWGRIVAAVGKAGERADRDRLSLHIGGVLVAKNGAVSPEYVEVPTTSEYMKGDRIDITLDIGIGSGKATIYTCDLTHRYIDINGSYRS